MTLEELLNGINYEIKFFEKTEEGIQFNIFNPDVQLRPFKARWKYYTITDSNTKKIILHVGWNKVDKECEFFVANFGHKLVEDSVFSEIFNEIAYLHSKQEKNPAVTYFYVKKKRMRAPYLYSKHERSKTVTYKLISDAIAMNRQLLMSSKVRV
ncbi:MAG: hypothetical protein J6Y07_03560 [Alphaproteobacteria bacterium]|nr:hypothetical protein [Alphaproteobacteria bacterium]